MMSPPETQAWFSLMVLHPSEVELDRAHMIRDNALANGGVWERPGLSDEAVKRLSGKP